MGFSVGGHRLKHGYARHLDTFEESELFVNTHAKKVETKELCFDSMLVNGCNVFEYFVFVSRFFVFVSRF